jgi:cystathionine beta-lyase family protein involved in aluminum resistance
MYEAGTFYTVARSQSWNTRPNTPIGSQNFKPTLSLTNKKLNYRTKQLLQQQAVLQATNSEMRHLSKQIVLTKETIKRLEKSAKYEDIQPIIKKLRHANEQLAKKLAELELNKNEE